MDSEVGHAKQAKKSVRDFPVLHGKRRWEGENPTNDPPAITLELFASTLGLKRNSHGRCQHGSMR